MTVCDRLILFCDTVWLTDPVLWHCDRLILFHDSVWQTDLVLWQCATDWSCVVTLWQSDPVFLCHTVAGVMMWYCVAGVTIWHCGWCHVVTLCSGVLLSLMSCCDTMWLADPILWHCVILCYCGWYYDDDTFGLVSCCDILAVKMFVVLLGVFLLLLLIFTCLYLVLRV